jgi:hypothetical protein
VQKQKPAAAAAASDGTSAAPPTTAAKPTLAAVIILNGLPVDHMSTLSHATFRQPIRLPAAAESATTSAADKKAIVEAWQKVHPELRAGIRAYLEAKRLLVGEAADLLSVKVSPVPLRCYRAKWFAEVVVVPATADQKEKRPGPAGGILSSITSMFSSTNADDALDASKFLRVPTFLVGDAAHGVPYFRAINNGLLAGSRLAHSLGDVLTEALVRHDNVPNRAALASQLRTAVNSFHMYQSALATGEFVRAKAKAEVLSVARGIVQMSAKNPVQLVTLSNDVEQQVRKIVNEELTRKVVA